MNFQVFVVPGSHFDLGWCATIGECLSWGDEIIKRAVEFIQSEATYRFTIEYALFLKHFLQTYPEYRDKVRNLLLEGKLQICGTMVGAMEQILDGETLIREIVNAKRWIKEEFGIDVKTVQHSDLPGHTIQLPQILQKAGIENISYSRFHPPIPLHWWEAPDGSKVLACNHIHGYGWGFMLLDNRSELLVEELKALDSIWPSRNILMLQESDLLLPEPEIVEKVAELNKKLQDIKLKISVLDEFFAAVRSEKAVLPVYKGEAPYGFYSLPATQPLTYKEARTGENKLMSAEKFASLREILGLGSYPSKRIELAWESLFYCHDHNVSGRRGDLNNEVREKRAIYGRVEGEEILREVLLSIGIRVKYSQKGEPLVVFNPLNWRRDDVIQVYMKFPNEQIRGITVEDQEGRKLPVQILKIERAGDNGRVDFSNENITRVDFLMLVKDIPPIGYKTFYVYPVEEVSENKNHINVESNLVENSFYRIDFSDKNQIKLWWKDEWKELSGKNFLDVTVFEDLRWDLEDALEEQAQKEKVPEVIKRELEYEPDKYYREGRSNFTGTIWNLFREKAEIIESGPIRVVLRLEGKVLNSTVIEDVILYHHIPRIDFKITIDWEGKKNTQVRVKFPFNVPNSKMVYEVPFYGVEFGKDEMPNTYRGIGGRFVQKWIDVSNEDFGVTFGTQSCAHVLNNSTIEPILIRSVYSCGDPFIWSLNRGLHTFNFSIIPHKGDWKEAYSYRLGWEFNNPLEYFQTNIIEPISPLEPKIEEEFSLVEIDNPSIVVTTIKKSFNSDELWVLRCFDAIGIGGETNITFPLGLDEVWMSNLIEEPVKKIPIKNNNRIDIEFKPAEILTILLKFKKEAK